MSLVTSAATFPDEQQPTSGGWYGAAPLALEISETARVDRRHNSATTEAMSIAIRCILEQDVPGIPDMEGKSLCMAYCGETASEGCDTGPATNLVTLDFGGPKKSIPPQPAAPAPAASDELLAPLGAFITGDAEVEWHDPAEGLTVVRGILNKLHVGATVSLDPDFDFFGDDEEELTEAVTFDLETLEDILVAAQKRGTRFRLMIDA